MRPYLLLASLMLAILFVRCDDPVQLPETVSTNDEYITQARESTSATAVLFSNLIKLAYIDDLSRGLQSVEPRQLCPDIYTFSDGIYPDTSFVKFDNCNPSFVFNQNYDGNLMFIINGPLDDLTTCPLVTIQTAPGFGDFIADLGSTPNDRYSFQINNPIEFCLSNSNGDQLKYDYELSGPILVRQGYSSFNGSQTTYPSGMTGCTTIKAVTGDDITDISSLTDNRFCVSIDPTSIICSGEETERMCIATDSDGISFFFACGCPDSGTLYVDALRDPSCSDVISDSNAYDFGYNPSGSSCDNDISGPNGSALTFDCGF